MDCSPIPLRTGGSTSAASLYLVHDGSGLCYMFSQLHDLGRDLYGFSNPGLFDADDQPSSLIQMAARYASDIDTSAERPVILGGYSFGGIVAFEMARQLLQKGKEVKGLILIDSPYPIDHEPIPNSIIAYFVNLWSRKDPEEGEETRQLMSTQFQANAALLGKYKPPATETAYPKVIILRSRETFDCDRLCGIQYPWISDQEARKAAIIAWEQLIGQSIPVLDIPGNHFEAFMSQNIPELSQQMRKACDLIGANSSGPVD